MKYTKQEVLQFIKEEDVKFVRLAFCDVFGVQKNISVLSGDLERAFDHGVAIDASAVAGFGGEIYSDLFLRPCPETLVVFPWRPEHGRVVRLFCDVTYQDGRIFENDSRNILKVAVAEAEKAGYFFDFGSEMEFYLFRLDENGEPTKIPYDKAGYMDIAPDDKGENVRREICLILEQMGICPESSQHEEGPGQNEIDFRYSDALTAADNAVTFKRVVNTVASMNGLCADFSPQPIEEFPGNGFHINVSLRSKNGDDALPYVMAGMLDKAYEMTAFLNPTDNSYKRLGSNKAPGYISWSSENRSQLIRIPASTKEHRRAELRSPDSGANPYIAFALIIYAGLYGIQNKLALPEPKDINLYTATEEQLADCKKLPQTRAEAVKAASESEFIARNLPKTLIEAYCANG